MTCVFCRNGARNLSTIDLDKSAHEEVTVTRAIRVIVKQIWSDALVLSHLELTIGELVIIVSVFDAGKLPDVWCSALTAEEKLLLDRH
jgi:hypothetical protein